MMEVPLNALTVKIYAGSSTTERPDNDELRLATDFRFTTVFPFGLYGVLSFFIPRPDESGRWNWKPGDRTVVKNGLTVVWEGENSGTKIVSRGDTGGVRVDCIGQWGGRLGRQTINKRWADNRLSEWRPAPDDQFTAFDLLIRDDTLTAVTKEIVYRDGDLKPMGRYWMPTGETVKRITFDYAFFNEGRWTPDAAKHNDDPGGANTFTDLDNTLDNDPATFSAFTLTADDYIYIGTSKPRFEELYIQVDMGSVVNANAATLSCEYSQGGGAWAAQAITDGTASGGATLAQDGLITIQPNKDWERERVDDKTLSYFRFEVSANLTASIRIVSFEFVQNQSFKLALYNNTDLADEWDVTSTGSGSADVTFGTPDPSPGFYFQSIANQQGFGNGSVYGSISNIVVYSETGSITVNAVVTDIHGLANYLNSETSYIDANSLSVVPLVSADYESLASLLERVTAFGDSSQNSWHAYLLGSEWAASPDGKPVLALKQYPALSDYDYVVRINEENIVGDIEIALDDTLLANWVIVAYRDAESGIQKYLTPDDNSVLKDDTSIASYGERHAVINAGEATTTTALAFGRRYLQQYKTPLFYVSSPITVHGSIRTKSSGVGGSTIPAANIQAGKRLRVENFLHDFYTTTGVIGLVEIINETEYVDSDQSCRMSLGKPGDDASILLARAIAATTTASIGGPLGLPVFG